MVVAGIEQNRADLRQIGEEYVAAACRTDLKSRESVRAVYQQGVGNFWVLTAQLESAHMQESPAESNIIGSIGEACVFGMWHYNGFFLLVLLSSCDLLLH